MGARRHARPAGRSGIPAIAVLLLLGSAVRPLPADDAGDNVEIHGFVLGNVAGRTAGLRPSGAGNDFLLVEERLRLDVEAWADSVEVSARVKADFLHDAVDAEFDLDLREAYVDYATGRFDVRVGRQIATWGVGDLLFINDVFPKDWVSFFSGRPLEYLKIGVEGLRVRYSSDAINAEWIGIPRFTADNVPDTNRFFLFDPFFAVTARDEDPPPGTFRNTEWGLRLYRGIGGFDVSAYAYRGFWRTPSLEPDNPTAPARARAFHPPLSVYGASLQGNVLGGVLSLEAGYYRSRDDVDGEDPILPNSQVRFLVGYQRQVWEDAVVGVQYYAERMEDSATYRRTLPPGFPAQKGYRDVVTLRLGQMLAHQTWKLAAMCFYSPADRDYLLQPQATYNFSDRLTATVGANLFGGERDSTAFGQLDRNDNVYLSVRFDF